MNANAIHAVLVNNVYNREGRALARVYTLIYADASVKVAHMEPGLFYGWNVVRLSEQGADDWPSRDAEAIARWIEHHRNEGRLQRDGALVVADVIARYEAAQAAQQGAPL